MVEAILELVMSEQQAQTMLSNQLIELIFMVLFITFALAFLVHFMMYFRLKKIRHFLEATDSVDVDPLRTFKEEFDKKQQEDSVKVETFVQQKFSSWRMFHIPVVSLMKMIQMTVSVFILVGVLGTFIGLTMSLGSIDSTGDQLVENVASVLAGIDVAFYTSIVGMGLSLVMTVIIRVANTEYLLTDIMLKMESHLEGNEQNPIDRLIEVSETINSSIIDLRETNQESLQNIEKSFKGFQEYTIGLQKAAEDLSKFNEGLSNNIQDFTVLFTNMKIVTSGFDKAATKLNDHFNDLFTYFDKMDKRNDRMSQAFQYTSKKIEELAASQVKTLHQFEDSMEDWKEYLSAMDERQESSHGAFKRMNAQCDDLVKLMKENNKQFKGVFGEDVSSKLSGIHSSLKDMSSDFDRLGSSIVQLPEALETISKTQSEYKHLISDRFDDLKEFNKEFNQHLKAHSAESNAFERQLRDASSSYEQINIKNNQLINEINRTMHEITDSFSQREKQIDSSVEVLKDTLSRYVTSLDGTLGDKLDKVGRNIGDYVMDMNGAIKKEFKQIGEITDQNQQKNIRLSQQMIYDLNQEFQELNRQLRTVKPEEVRHFNRIKVGSNHDQ
ncbi:MotA/TolQ/ExbB proton channel family protein [Salipaludibacillus sp. CF4.18]|uniref:MotA/TolQ/ExbB proton channel family protein n=1 Tax=Salipaludibacillus sp. CF4.18 TaxID=3373081 RepID=UPI003EE74D08